MCVGGSFQSAPLSAPVPTLSQPAALAPALASVAVIAAIVLEEVVERAFAVVRSGCALALLEPRCQANLRPERKKKILLREIVPNKCYLEKQRTQNRHWQSLCVHAVFATCRRTWRAAPQRRKPLDQVKATLTAISDSSTPSTITLSGTRKRLYSAARQSSGTMPD